MPQRHRLSSSARRSGSREAECEVPDGAGHRHTIAHPPRVERTLCALRVGMLEAAGVIERSALRSTGTDIGPNDVFLVGTQLPLTVEIGASVTVDLVFRPNQEAVVSDVVVLHAADHQPLEIGVTGQGIVPLGDVLCTPSRVDFSRVERGSTKIETVTCEARGGPARVIGATTSGGAGMFVLPSPPNTTDLTTNQTMTIEVEFRLDGPGSFLVGCDSDKHVGRVVVNAAGLSIAEDSVKPSHTIAKLPFVVKPGEWHHLRVEWKGDQMAANLDGHELKAQHPFLTTAKARSWLAAGKVVQVRNLTIRGEKTAG